MPWYPVPFENKLGFFFSLPTLLLLCYLNSIIFPRLLYLLFCFLISQLIIISCLDFSLGNPQSCSPEDLGLDELTLCKTILLFLFCFGFFAYYLISITLLIDYQKHDFLMLTNKTFSMLSWVILNLYFRVPGEL